MTPGKVDHLVAVDRCGCIVGAIVDDPCFTGQVWLRKFYRENVGLETVLPIGSIVHIEGVGRRMVQDTGSLVRGRHVDVYVETCEEARAWGRQTREVLVLHRPTRRSTDAGLKHGAIQGAGGGATSEKRTPPPIVPLIESAPGAGFRAGVSEAPTPSGAALTGDCARQALAGAPRAGALSISGSWPIEARR